jgi:hypothetical protein
MLNATIHDHIYPFKVLLNQDQAHVQDCLACFNERRLRPGTISPYWAQEIILEQKLRILEGSFLEDEREAVIEAAKEAPQQVDAFLAWFENLAHTGPGQNDALFPWLAQAATLENMKWFLTQESVGEAGFDDLVALSQIRVLPQAKLELARNYWDEMGRGHQNGMHSYMLDQVAQTLGLQSDTVEPVWEARALANLMVGLAMNRRYAYHAIGALGVIELTAPGRVKLVNDGLKRLGINASTRQYFEVHAHLDVRHSEAWNREVLKSLLKMDSTLAQPLAEGALMRLNAGKRCFERYREEFDL